MPQHFRTVSSKMDSSCCIWTLNVMKSSAFGLKSSYFFSVRKEVQHLRPLEFSARKLDSVCTLSLFTLFSRYRCAQPKVVSLQCANPEDQADAESNAFCGYFKSLDSPFRECLEVLDATKVEPLYVSCIEDVCEEKSAEFACKALAALHEMCAEIDIFPDWRTPLFCRKSLR